MRIKKWDIIKIVANKGLPGLNDVIRNDPEGVRVNGRLIISKCKGKIGVEGKVKRFVGLGDL